MLIENESITATYLVPPKTLPI